jgi:hypothetical protein
MCLSVYARVHVKAKDTSTSGTLVNEFFLHNDALMLQVNDSLYVGGGDTGQSVPGRLNELMHVWVESEVPCAKT